MNGLLILVMLGALTLAFGVGLIYLPAGVITAGIELLVSGYVVAYLRAKQ